jgi:hypothetical protein
MATRESLAGDEQESDMKSSSIATSLGQGVAQSAVAAEKSDFLAMARNATNWREYGNAMITLVNQATELGDTYRCKGFLPEGAKSLKYTPFGNANYLFVGPLEDLASALFTMKTERGADVVYADLNRAAQRAKEDGFAQRFRGADYFVGKFN